LESVKVIKLSNNFLEVCGFNVSECVDDTVNDCWQRLVDWKSDITSIVVIVSQLRRSGDFWKRKKSIIDYIYLYVSENRNITIFMSKIYNGRRSRKHKNPHIKNQLMENKKCAVSIARYRAVLRHPIKRAQGWGGELEKKNRMPSDIFLG